LSGRETEKMIVIDREAKRERNKFIVKERERRER
jgi:hypothetical protein